MMYVVVRRVFVAVVVDLFVFVVLVASLVRAVRGVSMGFVLRVVVVVVSRGRMRVGLRGRVRVMVRLTFFFLRCSYNG